MLKKVLDKYFYTITMSELRLMNHNTITPEITYNSLLYLDLISCTEKCTASGIAEMLHVSKSAVTVKVNELISLGLVKKVQSEKDKRVFYLEMEEAAEKMYESYDKALYTAIEKVKEQYSQEEIQNFCKILSTLQETYVEVIEDGVQSH